MRVQQQESTDLELQHRLRQKKLKSQLQAVESALALRLEQMEQATAAEMDLQRERKQCTALQEQVDKLGELHEQHYHAFPYI